MMISGGDETIQIYELTAGESGTLEVNVATGVPILKFTGERRIVLEGTHPLHPHTSYQH